MTLDELNSMSAPQAEVFLQDCCAAPKWVQGMMQAIPFSTIDLLYTKAESIWFDLDEADHLLAFDAHPRIGDVTSLKKKYASTATIAGGEQVGMSSATTATIEKMAQLNEQYLNKFGFIFIVCASGKSAEQMLAIIEQRIDNDYKTELDIAADEQAKITRIRLTKGLA